MISNVVILFLLFINSCLSINTTDTTIKFGINPRQLSLLDMIKPLYSGLIARVYLHNIGKAIPDFYQIEYQGIFWADYYDSQVENKSSEKFVTDTIEMEEKFGVKCRGR